MSDFKIRPPVGGENTAPTGAAEESTSTGDVFKLDAEERPEDASSVESSSEVEPSEIIEQLRSGQITFDQAIEVLVEQALSSHPIAVSDTIRGNIRNALIEMVHNDPTLSALASAMKSRQRFATAPHHGCTPILTAAIRRPARQDWQPLIS